MPKKDFNYLWQKYPDVFATIDSSKHLDLDLMSVTCGQSRKLFWKCKYNSEHSFQTRVCKRVVGSMCPKKECQNRKREETCMRQYGCKNVFEAEHVKQKIKKINRMKSGTEPIRQNSDVVKNRKLIAQCKWKNDLIAKYNSDHPIQELSDQNATVHELCMADLIKTFMSFQPKVFGNKDVA